MSTSATRSVLCLLPDREIEGLESFRQQYIQHPGKDVPFHATLLYNFYLPPQIDDSVMARLKAIAEKTPQFEFSAKPLCMFPTTRVLYLAPVPVTPLETLVGELHQAFPKFYDEGYGLSIMHMTIALGNPTEATEKICEDYFARFGRTPLKLRAGAIGVFIQQGEKWTNYLTVPIGH